MNGVDITEASADGRSSLSNRRALEALRAGVPNRDAVAALGSQQTAVEDRFTQLLGAIDSGPGGEPAGGMLISGGFGAGKSHVLEYLSHLALGAGFVVSKVVISKETALHDPAKVFAAAIDDARIPGKTGSAIDEIARRPAHRFGRVRRAVPVGAQRRRPGRQPFRGQPVPVRVRQG